MTILENKKLGIIFKYFLPIFFSQKKPLQLFTNLAGSLLCTVMYLLQIGTHMYNTLFWCDFDWIIKFW